MALTEITVKDVPVNSGLAQDGVTIDKTNGNKFAHSNRTFAVIVNEDATNSITATVASNKNSAGKSATQALAVAAGGIAVIGPFDSDFSKDGFVEVTYSGTASTVSIAAYNQL